MFAAAVRCASRATQHRTGATPAAAAAQQLRRTPISEPRSLHVCQAHSAHAASRAAHSAAVASVTLPSSVTSVAELLNKLEVGDDDDLDEEFGDDADDDAQEYVPYHSYSSSAKAHGKSGNTAADAAAAAALDAPADISDVMIVRDKASAERVLLILTSANVRGRYHAVDTEVADIDVKTQSPVGHGRVTCFSVYVGADVDFSVHANDSGSRDSDKSVAATGVAYQSRLYVDTLDTTDGSDMFNTFRPYFTDSTILKVWHNYGFDRHVLYNHGVDVVGFGGDTMHMARLWDAARKTRGGYGLSELSASLLGAAAVKRPMKERFGVANKRKDGSDGAIRVLPPIDEIQRDPQRLSEWIDYATYDTKATWEVREKLEMLLRAIPWNTAGKVAATATVDAAAIAAAAATATSRNSSKKYVSSKTRRQQQQQEAIEQLPPHTELPFPEEKVAEPSVASAAAAAAAGVSSEDTNTMYHFYHRYYRPFGEILTDMERAGFYIRQDNDNNSNSNSNYVQQMRARAEADRAAAVATFRSWAESVFPSAQHMNIQSAAQKQQFFFGDVNTPKSFTIDNSELQWIVEGKSKATKQWHWLLPGCGMPVSSKTKKGAASVNNATLKQLCGSKLQSENPRYGTAYNYFGGAADNNSGRTACLAIAALIRVSAVDIMLNTFIKAIATESLDSDHRVHCSLNINTETGRLSSRKPNLQNQPALEKDVYKIRDAFAAAPGNKLIVADYGQLELRVLAHMSNCKSMLHAFELGGDFHSRTALGMYDYIAAAVSAGACVLEWDSSVHGGAPSPVPLLKDLYGAERRRAKVLNFSIAYGKTAHGLAADFGVTVSEAQAIVDLWYRDRPEVKRWQEQHIAAAKQHQWSRTLMGRYRPLPGIVSSSAAVRSHNERAAINTPVQGGAADIVMMAMIKLSAHERFRSLGWRMILQVHDELICEGPEESTSEAMAIVVMCMEQPFKQPLLVALTVDAKADYTWYKAK